MNQILLPALAATMFVALILNWLIEKVAHENRLARQKLRVHVNGIRGKSTVTRIIAGMLREADYQTIGKTTGSAACLIDLKGNDQPIQRAGSPTILEQVDIVKKIPASVDALVIECMAIKPEYQKVCEDKIVQSHIGIITNVREDHQDLMGESLTEIAESLLSTCPQSGILITAEQNRNLLPLFRKVARLKQTELVVTHAEDVSDEELQQFPYVAFKENIAIGFAVAKLKGIDRQVALTGMVKAAPDPGVLRIERRSHRQLEITWADLFAVNDRESVVSCVEKVSAMANPSILKIGILNNRQDREQRAIQFAQIAARDIQLDYVVTLGAYEQKVESELARQGFDRGRIICLGSSKSLRGEELVDAILKQPLADRLGNSTEFLLFGLVNIHTAQATSLRSWFGAANSSKQESEQ